MKALRFSPPALSPTPELRWVLHRAFADPSLAVAPPSDPGAALDLARQLDLAGRIGARSPDQALGADLGTVAGKFTQARYATVARVLRYEVVVRQLGERAGRLGVPLVLLKGSALAFLGLAVPGSRSFGDLDLLVPADRIPEMRSSLVAAGWTASPLPPSSHQDSPLTHPSLGMIELHICIPGVRPPGSRRSFDARTLPEAGRTEALPGFGHVVRVPTRDVLIAHALEHGLVQHGYAPQSYPLFRFLADLQDLGADAARLREAGALLRDVDAEDLGAIDVLLAALESGAACDLADGPARALLAHFVVGTLDAGYALSLKTDPQALRYLSDLPPALAAARSICHAVFISRAEVDAIYGRPKLWGGYAARQLFRPFDLVLRLVRSLKARQRVGTREPMGS